MKLYYRGLSFEYDPAQVVSSKTRKPFQQVRGTGPAYDLIYRGSIYHVDPNIKAVEVPVSPATHTLIYRGITYLVNRTAQGVVTVVTKPASTPKGSILSLFRTKLNTMLLKP
ncbi:MAG TPA: DUF4278 domain-containing protein [Allocoleopsis sp.]